MAVSRSLRDPPREGLGTVRLHVLGSPSVQRDDQPCGGAAAQRKSLALLALLAVAGRRGLSRDKILALLWPEIPGDKATHRLAQLLYSLRRDLQAEELFLGSPDLFGPGAVSQPLKFGPCCIGSRARLSHLFGPRAFL